MRDQAVATGDRWRWLAAALATVSIVVGYWPTIDGYFLADDFGYIQVYWQTPLSAFPRLFITEWSNGIWDLEFDELRPLVAASFRLNTWLSGLNPVGYHLFNLLAHAAATWLVLAVGRRLVGASWWRSTLAALLFAWLPVHAELVGWISGRVDVMTTAFALLTTLGYGLYRQGGGWRWYITALVAMFLALFTKEAALTFILLVPAWDLVGGGRLTGLVGQWRLNVGVAARVVAGWAPFVGVLGLYVWARSVAFPNPLREGKFTAMAVAEYATRQVYYLQSMLLPNLGPLEPPAWSDVGGELTVIGFIWLGLCVFGGLVGLVWPKLGRGARLAIFFGPVWYLVTTLPLIVTYPSVRHLYLPSAGVCVVVACLVWLDSPSRGRRWAWRAATLAVLAMCGWALMLRQFDGAELAATSKAIHQSTLAALARAPAGSRVVVIPEVNRGERWLWRWATPFAYQPPFASVDYFEKLDLIELPEAYCCPEWSWWRDRARSMIDWVHDERGATTLLVWDTPNNRLIERPISYDELTQRLAAIGVTRASFGGVEGLRLMAELDPNPGTLR